MTAELNGLVLQVERRCLDGLLLVANQSGEAVGERVSAMRIPPIIMASSNWSGQYRPPLPLSSHSQYRRDPSSLSRFEALSSLRLGVRF